MTKVSHLKIKRAQDVQQEITAACKPAFVCLAMIWHARQGNPGNASKLLQVLVRSDLSKDEIEVTAHEREIMEASDPFSVLTKG